MPESECSCPLCDYHRKHPQIPISPTVAAHTMRQTVETPGGIIPARPDIDRCPICTLPGHASETDDAGRHPMCVKRIAVIRSRTFNATARAMVRDGLTLSHDTVIALGESAIDWLKNRLDLVPTSTDHAVEFRPAVTP